MHFQRDYMKVLQFHCQGTFLISQKNNNKRTLLPIKGIIFRKSSPSLSMYIIKLILVLKIWNKIECTNLDMYFNMMAKNLSLKLSYMHSYEDKFFQRNNYFFYKNTQTVTLITHLNWKNFPQKNFNQSLYSNSEIQESFS